MSAELLRRAAALMRGRAETAAAWMIGDGPEGTLDRLRTFALESHAQHLAHWQPAVALALADWLEAEAYVIDGGGHHLEAEAVARAYLGEDS